MRALVVHESMFGNTETVARAVADGLSTVAGVEVDCGAVHSASTDLAGVDLLVVGGPTHAFSMSRASTRADAVTKGADDAVASGPGIREWIEELEPTPSTAVAAFDTRVRRPRVPGSAARAARKHLRSRGFKAVGPPTTFWVHGMTGPLDDGEEARARQWGADLGTAWVSQRALPS
jgi:flavodoxin